MDEKTRVAILGHSKGIASVVEALGEGVKAGLSLSDVLLRLETWGTSLYASTDDVWADHEADRDDKLFESFPRPVEAIRGDGT